MVFSFQFNPLQQQEKREETSKYEHQTKSVTGHNTIPKSGQIEFPTLLGGESLNDNSLDSPVVEEDAAHGTSGGTIHDSGAFS